MIKAPTFNVQHAGPSVRNLLTFLLIAASCTAQAQQNSPQATLTQAAAPAQAQPGQYPISIPVRVVTRAGITPGTGYVLLRDIKPLVDVSANGRSYTLKTARSTVRFTAGSRHASLNGHAATLNATPIQLSETLLFPLASLNLLGCSAQPLESMRNVRAFTLTCDDQDLTVNLSVLTFSNTNAPAGAVQPGMTEISRLRR